MSPTTVTEAAVPDEEQPKSKSTSLWLLGHTFNLVLFLFTKKGFSCAPINLITQTYEGFLTIFLLIWFFMLQNPDILHFV